MARPKFLFEMNRQLIAQMKPYGLMRNQHSEEWTTKKIHIICFCATM